MDLKLEKSGDLVFNNGVCPFTRNYGDVVAQRLFIRLRTFKSEWFLSEDYGVPYFTYMGKKVPKARIDLILQEQILLERGVSQITEFSSYISNKREYFCNFSVRTDQGTEVRNLTL